MVDHANMMILIVIRDGSMTKLLTTKQVSIDTDYRYFVTFRFGYDQPLIAQEIEGPLKL